MKILHVYRTFFPDTQGGLEEVIRQICLNTRDHGIESRVFALSREPSPATVTVDGVTVIRVAQTFEVASCGFCFTGFSQFRRQVAWADVVHYHFPWPWGDMLSFLGGAPRACVVTYHSDIVRQRFLQKFYSPVMHRFLESADRIVATSPNYIATSDILARFVNKVKNIPIGIDESSYPALEGHDRTPFGEVKDYFLFVGVLRYYKGLHILLEAARDADYQCVIVGSGPVEEELKIQARQLSLDNVIFAGQVDEESKMALFARSRAVVFPSYLRAEAFGVTLLEGAMHGKPLISAEIGTGTSHINVHGETGLVIPPGCSVALRDAMDYLHYNPAEAEQLGEAARARYEALFTGQVMGERYAQLYRELVDNPGQSGSEFGQAVA